MEKNFGENASINRYEVDDIAESRSELEQQRQLVARTVENETILKRQLHTLQQLKQSPYFGRIDILAAYAGGTFDGNPNMTQQQVLEKTTAVNQWGMYYTCFAVVPQMKKQKSGKIIICSSNGAFNPTAPAYEYHMAKGACESLTVNLAMDLAKFGIRVNCVKPGPIVTAFWDELMEAGAARDAMLQGIADIEVPLGRTGVADDIAGPALFLASDLSSYITGLCLYVGGGMGYVYAYGQSSIAHAGVGRTDL